MSDLPPAPPTKWLAKGWMPYSEITVLVGAEGIGKSLYWVRLAAHVTTGRSDPSIGLPTRKPRDVVAIVTEDTRGEVEARLRLAGADLDRVYLFCSGDDGTGFPVFGNAFNGAMAFLDADMEALDVALVVVDAWVDTVAAGLVLKDGQQARQAMKPWKQLAVRHKCSVVLCTHTNRMNTADIRTLMGTSAILRQVARSLIFAGTTSGDRGAQVWFGPDKNNVSGTAPAVKLRIDVVQVRPETDDDTGRVAHLIGPEASHSTIQQLMYAWKEQTDAAGRPPTKQEQCEQAIRDFMAGGPSEVTPTQVLDAMRHAGFGKHTAEKAMAAVGRSDRAEFGGSYVYTLLPTPGPHNGEQGT